MKNFLNRIDYSLLILIALLLGLAPFYPRPHLVEKVHMLADGALHRPIDIFDLIMHSAPVLLLLGKILADLFDQSRRPTQ